MQYTANPDGIKPLLRQLARQCGFSALGFAPPTAPAHADALLPWLAAGHHGDMAWLARDPQRRMDPAALMPGLGVVLVLGINHRPAFDPLARLRDPGAMSVAAYAQGQDYHEPVKKRLKELARALTRHWGAPLDGRVFVDTAPLLERPVAAGSALGWQGRNTMLVSRTFGCWLTLGEYFLPLPLTPDTPHRHHCGDCRRCVDICPTGALDQPFQLAGERCLAFLTNESHGAIPRSLRRVLGNRVFGCDDCVAVCPFNRFAPVTTDAVFTPRPLLEQPRLVDFARLDEARFATMFRHHPIKRLGLDRFGRNLAVALGNQARSGTDSPGAVAALGHLLTCGGPLSRAHAAWGLGEVARGCQQAWALLWQQRHREENGEVQQEIVAALEPVEQP
ncbi:MAG: tRNA epoxyqueuosine(34) reductase QueG [Magnetococcus sp. WYHC-3]